MNERTNEQTYELIFQHVRADYELWNAIVN